MSPADKIASIALIVSTLMMIASFLTIFFSNKATANTNRITLRLDFSHRYHSNPTYRDIWNASKDNYKSQSDTVLNRPLPSSLWSYGYMV